MKQITEKQAVLNLFHCISLIGVVFCALSIIHRMSFWTVSSFSFLPLLDDPYTVSQYSSRFLTNVYRVCTASLRIVRALCWRVPRTGFLFWRLCWWLLQFALSSTVFVEVHSRALDLIFLHFISFNSSARSGCQNYPVAETHKLQQICLGESLTVQK